MMLPLPRLEDIRQIGPGKERNISARCSACGDILLARLEDSETVNEIHLQEKLYRVFGRHMQERHRNNEVAAN